MDLDALNKALAVADGKLTLASDTLPGAPMQSLLTVYNGGNALTLENVTKQTTDTAVTVSGTATFMRVADLPVTAVFTLDSAQNPVASIRFTLIDGAPGPAPWRFSQSFPGLPPFPSINQYIPTGTDNLLDQLVLSDAAFVLNTAAGKDAVTGAPLGYGLNFVAQMNPAGLTGLFNPLLTGGTSLLYGTITMPRPTGVTPQLPALASPWQALDWTVPGIQLQAPLGVELSVGPLSLKDTVLRFYCPTSADWLAENRTYEPEMGITGSLVVPSANLQVDVTAFLAPDQVELAGVFQGFTLDNLEQLTDIVQGGDLFSHLPNEVQSALQKVGGLSLMAAGIGFSGGLTAASVDYAYVTVGMPNVNWQVFDGMTVDAVATQFMVSRPFGGSGRSVSATLKGTITLAGVTFDIFTGVPNFTVRADLERSATLPLNSLFQQYLPELPAPPDLSVDEMQVWISPGKSYSFMAGMADSNPWQLDLGPTGLTISDVQLYLEKSAGASATGSFSGGLKIGNDLYIDAGYDLPGDFYVRAELPEFKLSQLVGLFDELGLQLPSGFDVDLQQSYVLVSEEAGVLTFTAATDVSGFGLLAFSAQKAAGKTGVAAGIQLDVAKLSAVSGLSALQAMDDMIGLEKLMFVASSLDQPTFQFPAMANFQAPALSGKTVSLPPQASGLVRGLNFYAQLSMTNSKGLQALAKYLGIPLDGTVGVTVGVSLPDPTAASKLFVSVSAQISPGSSLTGKAGLMFINHEPGAFLTAQVKTKVQGQPMEFDVTAEELPNGVQISGVMLGTIKFNPSPVQLSNLMLMIGIDWEGIPSLGLAATLDVKNFNSSVAVFFDSKDPSQSLFAGAISGLSLKDIANTLAGQKNIPGGLDDVLGQIALQELKAFTMPATVAAALDGRDLTALAAAFSQYGHVTLPSNSRGVLLVVNTKGSVWHVTDMTTLTHYSLTRQGDNIAVSLQPQIYCAPANTWIDPVMFYQGFHVDAGIDFLMLKAQLQVIVNSTQGISADASMDPITIYKPSFFAVSAADGKSGPQLSLATFNQPAHPDPNLRGPHFMVTGKLCLLGQDIIDTYISISSKGLAFDIARQINPVLYLDIHGAFDSLTNITAGGKIVVGISKGLDIPDLGHINVNTTVNGKLDLGYKGGAAYATVQGGFQFQEISGTIPTLKLNVDGPSLANIADTLWAQVKDIITKALASADQWLKWVKAGIVQGAGQTADAVGKVLDKVYHLSKNDIAKKTQAIMGYGIDQVTQALSGAGATADQAAQALASVGYKAADIAKAVGAVFKGVHVDTSLGHVDQTSPHLDTPKSHVDVPGTHTDTKKHVDIGGDHVDGKKWGVHADTGTPHSDSRPHVDQNITPHGDTNTPHADTTPHVDTGTHVDVKT